MQSNAMSSGENMVNCNAFVISTVGEDLNAAEKWQYCIENR